MYFKKFSCLAFGLCLLLKTILSHGQTMMNTYTKLYDEYHSYHLLLPEQESAIGGVFGVAGWRRTRVRPHLVEQLGSRSSRARLPLGGQHRAFGLRAAGRWCLWDCLP